MNNMHLAEALAIAELLLLCGFLSVPALGTALGAM